MISCNTNTVHHGNFKNKIMTYNRRTFIKGMATVTAAIPFTNVMASSVARPLKISINIKLLMYYGQRQKYLQLIQKAP